MDVATVQRPSLAAAAPRAQPSFEVGYQTVGTAMLAADRFAAIVRGSSLAPAAEEQLTQALLRLRERRTGPLAVVELLGDAALELSPTLMVERRVGLLELLNHAETHVAAVVQGTSALADGFREFLAVATRSSVRFSLHEEPASAISWASHRIGSSRAEVAELLGLAQSLAARS